MTTITDFPVAQLPVDPFLKMFTETTNGMFAGSNAGYSLDLLFSAMGVDIGFGSEMHQAFYIVVNTLDRPLTLTNYYEGHGYLYMQPGIVRLPADSPDTPVLVTGKLIPGRVEAMIPDSPDGPDGAVTSDVDTFGVGIFRTGKDGMMRGTEAAFEFATTDPRVPTRIGIAGSISQGGGALYQSGSLDISTYGTLQSFHDKTVDSDAPTYLTNSGDIFLAPSRFHAGINTGMATFEDGWEQAGVFVYFIGPLPS